MKTEEKNCYLVVCPTKKRAAASYGHLRNYICSKRISSLFTIDDLSIFVDEFAHEGSVAYKTSVRFISERDFYKAVKEGRGEFIVDETEVTKWLCAAQYN